ncbi:MAG: DUF4249 domain-containing protein [Chryseolinea sp.]
MCKFVYRISIFVFLLLVSCVEPFDIESVSFDNLLIVDGFISSDMKQHKVVLSRTSKINEKIFIPETGAQVSIKDISDATIELTEESPGIYLTGMMAGVIGNTYVLNIKTQTGKQYISSEVELRDTPEIKNISATYTLDLPIGEGSGGFQFFLDTEDSTNQARFYRWEFKETYEIKTPFPSTFVWLGDNNVEFRDVPVDHCWGSDSSRNILIKSTQELGESKVTSEVIHSIPGYSPNMRIKYSILVRQFALSKDAYLYWKSLRDVNQSQGTLYDTQPGTVRGNITSLTSSEIVLGYFDAGVIAEKRAFFVPSNFTAAGYKKPQFLTSCDNFIPIEVKLSNIGSYLSRYGENLEISEAVGTGDVTFYLRPRYCCNCTNLGINKKPSFWQ